MSKTTQAKKQKALVEDQKQIDRPAQEEMEKETVETTTESEKVTASKPRQRGKKYLKAKSKVDINKYYPLSKAVKLAQETSISKFEGKLEAHLVVTETGNIGEITFPHYQGEAKRIAVVDDQVIAKIKDGNIDFDILIATPVTMGKLLPFARVLGPKGLMPNPKNGTLTDDTALAVKKLSAAKTPIRTEKKAPVVHMIVGKISQSSEELEANVDQLIKTIGNTKIKKLVLAATMGPGIKVSIE